jgi:putative Ca2+/H+ antiporter (TMEM165/GDT1 family)
MASSYTTQAGDTFDSIALSEMGDEAHLGLIVLANPEHAYTLEFSDGVTLTIPDTPEPDADTSLPPWRLT